MHAQHAEAEFFSRTGFKTSPIGREYRGTGNRGGGSVRGCLLSRVTVHHKIRVNLIAKI